MSSIRFLLGQVARTVQYRSVSGRMVATDFIVWSVGAKGEGKGGGGGETGAGQPSHDMMTEILTVYSI